VREGETPSSAGGGTQVLQNERRRASVDDPQSSHHNFQKQNVNVRTTCKHRMKFDETKTLPVSDFP
jgi:hypothetical protein